jgi:RsiW-degrading membrane proteinase PrsW (M82 family)
MFLGMNISLLLGLVIPPLIYAFIIYLTSPYKSIDFKTGIQYMLAGFSSVLLVSVLVTIFPYWTKSPIDFQNMFFFVAPREELSKLIAFFIIERFRRYLSPQDHPIGTMFYMCMVGLGFAMYENIQYIHSYGQEVLAVRLVTATIAHMLFGIFMGYWISLGRINTGKYGNRSVFGVMMNQNPNLKQGIYIFIGWLSAVCYHGLWNYNLAVSQNTYIKIEGGQFVPTGDVSFNVIMIMLIFFGLVGAKFASKDLNDNYRRKLKKNKYNE